MPVLILFILLIAIVPLGHDEAHAAEPADSAQSSSSIQPGQRLTLLQQDDVLWLARCIYSESDRPHEQRLVAWVVRNRVETKYRGHTYRDVVLETRQFSAFNEPSLRRERILKLTPETPNSSWQRAYAIAKEVYLASPSVRPFSQSTRHFYSHVSMKGRVVPEWAVGVAALDAQSLGVDPHRFRIYASVDQETTNGNAASGPMSIDDALSAQDLNGRGKLGSRIRRAGDVARPARPRRPGRAAR